MKAEEQITWVCVKCWGNGNLKLEKGWKPCQECEGTGLDLKSEQE